MNKDGYQVEITASGNTIEDALGAVDQAKAAILEGYTSGCSGDGNSTYGFDVEEPLGVHTIDPDQAPEDETDRGPLLGHAEHSSPEALAVLNADRRTGLDQ